MVDFRLYDARGNRYFVATPKEIREFVALPETAAEAAETWHSWTKEVNKRVSEDSRNADGVLVGPFPTNDGFGLLIVNSTDDLAERSGNGLTIFSQFLVDTAEVDRSAQFSVKVHHDLSGAIAVLIEPEERGNDKGFWIDMGTPSFGPRAVKASPDYGELYEFDGRPQSRVFALESIDASWTRSLLVSVDNPHCVTFLRSAAALSSVDARKSELTSHLTAIANSAVRGNVRGEGLLCPNGINLQFAFVARPDEVHARVFERGEGWTDSSGSSATAVACAARHLGLTTEALVCIEMTGGPAPVKYDYRTGRWKYFGVAALQESSK